MKRSFALLGLILTVLFSAGCQGQKAPAQVAATTLPVYEFTQRLCQNTGITVTRLITENVSCLHDYSLTVQQVKALEGAQTVVLSGGGLEHFLEDVLHNSDAFIDSSEGITFTHCEENHDHADHHHAHETDPHIWLSPRHAMTMATNICHGLQIAYPQHKEVFAKNLDSLLSDLLALEEYGKQQLAGLSCREIITFHDGFGYFAEAFDLTIIKAVEEESGSEASARELIHLISLTSSHGLPAVFTEVNSSASAADVIARETGAAVFQLDMAMSGCSYFDAMYHNISTVKEALG